MFEELPNRLFIHPKLRIVADLPALKEANARAEQMIAGGDDDPTVGGATFPRRIAFNAVPEIGTLGDDGFFTEESKVGSELRKILADDRLQVSCTATRVRGTSSKTP